MTRTSLTSLTSALTLGLALGLALTLAAGCSIPGSTFQATADADTGDAGPDTLSIIPSVTAFSVDEDGTAEFTIKLSHPPMAPLTVQVDSPSTAIGLTLPADLTFDTTNFSQPRTILVAGLDDDDVADAEADIALTAIGLPGATVRATVDDPDVAAVVVNVGTTINVDDGQSVDVRVHLSHKPESELTVSALLGAGPCTVNTTSLVFSPATYDTDQVFRFTANVDANAMNDSQTLTLRIGAADREFTLLELDGDQLLISASPDPLTVVEQGSAGSLNVALTQQPPATVTVMVSVVSQTGVVTVDKNQLTFTTQNYATNQIIQVTGTDDADIVNDTAKIVFTAGGNIPTREVTVNIDDNDAQEIQHDAGNGLTVDENGEITFGVRLKQEPSSPISVAVQSQATGVATVTQGSLLTFNAQNYNVAQTVRVKGTDDLNLANNSTKIRMFVGTLLTEVNVLVADDDQQELLVSTTMLNIPEGMSRTIDVTLKYEPLSTVTAMVTSTNATSLPATPPMLTFTPTDYATPHKITVNAPVDTNDVSETATITVMGAGAAQSRTIMASVMDETDVERWGWPDPFPSTINVPAGFVVTYKVDVGSVANIDSFHTYVPTATGSFRMALYTDTGNAPGTLVAEMPAGKVLTNGINDGPILNDPQLTAPTYFLAIRFSQGVNVGYANAGTTGRQCTRNLGIPNISDPWPSTFGVSTCALDRLINMWITTYHQ